MSKLEDKFKEIFEDINITTKELIKEAVSITEQECIGFKQWCENNASLSLFTEDEHYGKSNEDLFQLYLKSKEPPVGYWNKNDLLTHSKDVEVVDISDTFMHFHVSPKLSFAEYCKENGYQLIKINNERPSKRIHRNRQRP